MTSLTCKIAVEGEVRNNHKSPSNIFCPENPQTRANGKESPRAWSASSSPSSASVVSTIHSVLHRRSYPIHQFSLREFPTTTSLREISCQYSRPSSSRSRCELRLNAQHGRTRRSRIGTGSGVYSHGPFRYGKRASGRTRAIHRRCSGVIAGPRSFGPHLQLLLRLSGLITTSPRQY